MSGEWVGAGEVIDQARREETQALVRAAEGRRATVDEEPDVQICGDCGREFATSRNLKHHRTMMHGQQKSKSPVSKSGEARPTEAVRLVLVRDGHITLSASEFETLHPEFEFGGHRFHLLAVTGPDAFECGLIE